MTKHSVSRAIERAKLSEESAKEMIRLAKLQGWDAEQFSGYRKEYLLRKQRDGFQALCYAGFCFIFSAEGSCITMFPNPDYFEHDRISLRIPKCRCDGKTIVRHPKKYFTRYNDFYVQTQ